MNSQIVACFSNIEALIRSQFKDNIQNHSEIVQKFKEAIILLSEIEDENQHGFYCYKYYTTYSSYLRMIGDTENANKQEKLAKRYERYADTHAEGTQFVLYANEVATDDINQDDKLKEILETLDQSCQILENELADINVVDKLINEIQCNFVKLNRITKTFEGYIEAINCETYMNGLVDRFINEKLIFLNANSNSNEHENLSESENINTELIDHLRCLKLIAHKTAYSKRIEFISFIFNSPNKIEILFKNVINTEEAINKCFKSLSKCLHEDRTNKQNSLFVLQEIHKSQADELFKLILGFKEHLLNKLKKVLELEDHEKCGNELWKITIDYHNASKGQWNKIKVLKKR
ncbi:hypothetical protein F8M41_020562 [Gigaspora margarita]|uniref:Uncharacterized protein n=1 Tax=Gigaspora margarita TaxID=4874 RepID=A0A8H4B1S3_GIGMA|nr:hypothetical protein F8M41_020562 [Gigaspora margarita]